MKDLLSCLGAQRTQEPFSLQPPGKDAINTSGQPSPKHSAESNFKAQLEHEAVTPRFAFLLFATTPTYYCAYHCFLVTQVLYKRILFFPANWENLSC